MDAAIERREKKLTGLVFAAMVSSRIGVLAKRERLQHRPVHGPGPGERGLHADLERQEDRKQDDALHLRFLLVVRYGNRTNVARLSAVVKRGYSESR